MIFPFAIDPAVVVQWTAPKEFARIKGEFGPGHPRVFLEYPKLKRWRKQLRKLINLDELDDNRAVNLGGLIDMLEIAKVRRPGAPFDELRPWLENAEEEWDRNCFPGIISGSNPRNHEAVITEDSRRMGDGRWDAPRGVVVARSAAALANALRPLFEGCDLVHVVEPYFDGNDRGKRDVLVAMANLMAGAADGSNRMIVVHCRGGRPQDPSRDHFQHGAARCKRDLPRGITVKFRRWRQREGGDRIHNRYVLTHFGGVSLGEGVTPGNPGETDDLSVLSLDQWKRRWDQYTSPNHFEPVDDPELEAVTGER